jgi:TfoX/Sxy family transcriptional regulator of competence genes
VAYDEALADRIRALIGDDPDVTEKAMFGGLAFLVAGNMAVGPSVKGGLLLRVDQAQTDTLME